MTILGLFLNNQIRTGGHRRYLELMEDLASRGNRVLVILNEELDYRSSHFTALRLRARYVRRSFPPASGVFLAAVRRELGRIVDEAGKPDWILIHGETHLSAAAYLKRRLGGRLFFGSRSNVVRWSAISMTENRRNPLEYLVSLKENLVYRRYERQIASLADLVCFQSSFDRDDFLSRVSTTPRTVIIGGNIGGPRFKADQANINRSEKLRKLLFVGTLGERKGLHYLLKALSLLSAHGIDDLELDVLGSGDDLATHRAFAATQGLADRVRFHGRIPDPFPFYAAADLLVVPSLFDSYPDTVLEALHVGLPVIASRTGGIPDQLMHDELLIPIRDAGAIADRIEGLYRADARYSGIRRLCEERRRAFNFDWAAAWERSMMESS